MLRIMMHGPDPTENHYIRELLGDILWNTQIKPVFKEFTQEQEAFFTYVKNNPYLVMLIVQSGPARMETARLAKQANSAARLVWFSRQDYALFAFNLNLTFWVCCRSTAAKRCPHSKLVGMNGSFRPVSPVYHRNPASLGRL